MKFKRIFLNIKRRLNPLLPGVPLLYPLKTSENLWFSYVFGGYQKGTLDSNGLKALLKGIYDNPKDPIIIHENDVFMPCIIGG